MQINNEGDYKQFVWFNKKNKINLPIACSSKEHRIFILGVMDGVEHFTIDNMDYVMGRKYEIMIYNLKDKIGWANMNNKEGWRSIRNIINGLR